MSLIQTKNTRFLHVEIAPKKGCLANACLNWLPMLYYKGGSLKGVWGPSGIETKFPMVDRPLSEALV